MKITWKYGVALFSALVILGCPKRESMPRKTPGEIPENIARLAPAADLIFRGEVVALKTSTVDAEDPSAMGVVGVEEILAGSDFHQQFKGSKITVVFQEPGKMKTGEKKVFFTRVSAIGESLETQEVGSLDVKDEDLGTVRGHIDKARRLAQDEALATRIRNTSVVVSGRIASVKPADIQAPFDSEHWPEWMAATVEVKEKIKGDGRAQVTFLFPRSTDEMWRASPQFQEGDEGVFLLREKNTPLLDEKELSLTDPRDFLLPAEVERVKRLAK
jgi:hypothetical protein